MSIQFTEEEFGVLTTVVISANKCKAKVIIGTLSLTHMLRIGNVRLDRRKQKIITRLILTI